MCTAEMLSKILLLHLLTSATFFCLWQFWSYTHSAHGSKRNTLYGRPLCWPLSLSFALESITAHSENFPASTLSHYPMLLPLSSSIKRVSQRHLQNHFNTFPKILFNWYSSALYLWSPLPLELLDNQHRVRIMLKQWQLNYHLRPSYPACFILASFLWGLHFYLLCILAQQDPDTQLWHEGTTAINSEQHRHDFTPSNNEQAFWAVSYREAGAFEVGWGTFV